jgi:alpha-L-arabinofuranosidase
MDGPWQMGHMNAEDYCKKANAHIVKMANMAQLVNVIAPVFTNENGPHIKSANDFGKETVKSVNKPAVNAGGTKFTYSFPPHSFTLLKGKVQR